MNLRFSLPGDEPGLKKLWKKVFGDTDEIIDGFFEDLYSPGSAFAAEENGIIAAAAYVVPFGKARYIYAVATLPEYRGRGLGRAVTLGAADGKPAYLSPAEPSLVRWYGAMGAEVAGYRVQKTELPPERQRTPLSPEEYRERREALLSETPHAEYTSPVLHYFARYGEFCAFPGGIAALADGEIQEVLPCRFTEEPGLLSLNGGEPLYWGLTLG